MAKNKNIARLGFEKDFLEVADKIQGHMDASEYKHVVFGLVFLKYISDVSQVKYRSTLKVEKVCMTSITHLFFHNLRLTRLENAPE